MSDLKYRADIDGLRAIAVVPVVLFHAGFTFASGGFVGVDVFFVISGFLITSIIASEIDRGEFRLANFYERRARRLFPALFSVIAASTVAAWFLLMPGELEDFGESVATTVLFSSNFLFFNEAGYFAGPAELKPLLHTWSLAIEEQYYLLFPGLLILINRFLGARYAIVVAGLGVSSLALSIYSVSFHPDAAFYLLPSRTWELMLGSLLALLPLASIPGHVREVGGWLGLAAIAFAVFTYDAATAFPGVAALAPCVGTALIIICGAQRSESALRRLLSARPFVALGLISYSWYLWHWPLLVFARHYLMREWNLAEACALVALSMVVSWASWRFIERPFRGSGSLFDRRGLFRFSIGLMIGAVSIGLIYDISKGLPGRLPEPVAALAAFADDKPEQRKLCEGIAPEKVSFDSLCRVNELDVPLTFVVWGDSHAMAMMPGISTVARSKGVNGLNITSNGCVPLLGLYRPARDPEGDCRQFSDAAVAVLQEHPELKTVVLAARWARHAEGTGFGDLGEVPYFFALPDGEAAGSPMQNHPVYARALQSTLIQLADMGRQVVIVGSVPEIGIHVPDVAAKAAWSGREVILSVTEHEFMERQQFVHATFNELSKVFEFGLLEPRDYLCQEGICNGLDTAGMPLYFDDNHVSSVGARRLEPLFKQVLGMR